MATEEKTINVVGMHCPSFLDDFDLFIIDLYWLVDYKSDL